MGCTPICEPREVYWTGLCDSRRADVRVPVSELDMISLGVRKLLHRRKMPLTESRSALACFGAIRRPRWSAPDRVQARQVRDLALGEALSDGVELALGEERGVGDADPRGQRTAHAPPCRFTISAIQIGAKGEVQPFETG